MEKQEKDIEKVLQLISTQPENEERRAELVTCVNELILLDFDKLVRILYRLDIDEKKLKALLKQNEGTDAGQIIADLIIERQIQKIESRRQFKQRDDDISEEDKW